MNVIKNKQPQESHLVHEQNHLIGKTETENESQHPFLDFGLIESGYIFQKQGTKGHLGLVTLETCYQNDLNRKVETANCDLV